MVNNNKYSSLTGKVKRDADIFAYPLEDAPLAHELISKVVFLDELPFEFKLKRVALKKGELTISEIASEMKEYWVDYLPNSLAWPFMSEKMKSIINSKLSGLEGLRWIIVNIYSLSDKRKYWIPIFEIKLDVLDLYKSKFVSVPDHLIKPVFSLQKILRYSIFHSPAPYDFWKITTGLYVCDEIKRELLKEKITGISFGNINITE